MPKTIGYHIVLSGHGLWLPGDDRGHWSEAWDAELGLIEPHTLHPGDPVRKRIAQERMVHPPVRLSTAMQNSVITRFASCAADSDWQIVAASIESTHTHLLLTYTERNIDNTVKWLKDQTTKAIHRETSHQGPVWCKGKWRSFVFELDVWNNTLRYIERHNERRGVSPRPYPFLAQSRDRRSRI
ncbi:transposase [Bythopirellula goksoeyrii]|uniref:Transposase IS200 like protein n=1 Tax=Bythopirellula goksoeyrii TaxID=1400387 RepID=A0A5B9QIX2_9BACT|nr:transposase [Bythopirellula goksoeyrii]QEG37949.1 Transposase IS200 like protein [Bythopirellula goksoeyrii]